MSASTSRFLSFSSSLLRFHRTNPSSPLLLLSTKSDLFSPNPLRFRVAGSSFFSSSAAVEAVSDLETIASPISHHPWPEWVSFVDKLKTKGYFNESESVQNEAEAAGASDTEIETGAESVYTDMKLVEDACFSFARDRYDVFRSLSTVDIQKVVECGCPNIFRKAVNSAKRLRAYVRLDEGDVCGACNLRGSCDRAYVLLQDSVASARTVDIMQILLFHALDPLVLSGGEKPQPPGRKLAEESTKNLLSQLIELSITPVDPSLPKPSAKAPAKKEVSLPKPSAKAPAKKKVMNFNDDDDRSRNVEMRIGDWMCSKCNFMNFARNNQCFKCKEDGPKKVEENDQEMKKGDWLCSECNFLNFSKNKLCLRCKAERPKWVAADGDVMKKGDWNCPEYALDPLVLSGGEKPQPPGRKLAEESTKNLLSQLIELSITPVDPSLPKPSAKAPAKKKVSLPKPSAKAPAKKKVMNFNDDDDRSRNVEMRIGDWMCSKCNFMNFARNNQCFKCKEDGPKKVEENDQEMKKGDWLCSECNFLNFSKNKLCLRCKAERPKWVAADGDVMKKGDWNCPECEFMNFSSNRKCLHCQESRPKRQLYPGEWECTPCDFLNYSRNTACLKCERPKPETKGRDNDDEHL